MAGFEDLYPALPGHLVEFKDGGLALRNDQNLGTTESVLLLGTAVDGPINVPVAVDPTTVEKVFGKVVDKFGNPNGATLVQGFEECWNAGCRDIRLMRISGSIAQTTIKTAAKTDTILKPHKEDALGLGTGNDQQTFTLSNKEDDTITGLTVDAVYAGTKLLSSTEYTVNAINGTVTIKAGVCDAGANVTIQYHYTIGTTRYDVSENGTVDPVTGAFTPWVTTGSDIVLPFPAEYQPSSQAPVYLYAGGIGIDQSKFTVNFNASPVTVTIKADAVPLNVVVSASYSYEAQETYTPAITIKTHFGGSLYNNSSVKVEDIINQLGNVVGKKIIITKPEEKRTSINEPPLVYDSIKFPTFGSLVNAINSNPNNGIFKAECDEKYINVLTSELLAQPDTKFTGGTDGLDLIKDELYEKLGGKRDATGQVVENGAYQFLENYNVDIIVPLGVYADDELSGPFDNFAYQLALACAMISHRNRTTIGVIATSQASDTSLAGIAAHVDKLLAYKNDYPMLDKYGYPLKDREGNEIDLGRFIQVVVGPAIMLQNTRLGTYYANSAAAYAGMLSELPVKSSPMNKKLKAAKGLKHTFSSAQRNALVQNRFVVYKYDSYGNVVVEDASTAARPTSDYYRVPAMRATKEAVNQVRIATEPFLGEPNDVVNRNAMSAAIAKRLDAMVARGDIQAYNFQIVITGQDKVLGNAKIELTIVPPFEIRKITTVVSLTK